MSFKCEICNFKTDRQSSYKVHINKNHKSEVPKERSEGSQIPFAKLQEKAEDTKQSDSVASVVLENNKEMHLQEDKKATGEETITLRDYLLIVLQKLDTNSENYNSINDKIVQINDKIDRFSKIVDTLETTILLNNNNAKPNKINNIMDFAK